MYNSTKLDPPRENDVEKARSEWQKEKENFLKRNEYLSSFEKESDKDLTLLLSASEIREKIGDVFDIHYINDEWVYDHFKDAMEVCKILSTTTSFLEYASHKYPTYSWVAEPDETIEVKYLSNVKFDIIKTIEIMNNLLAERRLWIEYKGDIIND